MIIFIYGRDGFRSWQKIQDIKKKFIKKVDTTGSSIEVINGDDFDINEFREKIHSPALFTKERMIIIKNLLRHLNTKKAQSDILEILKKVDNNVVIFWEVNEDKNFWKKIIKNDLYKFLKKTKYTQEFDKLSGAELQSWVMARLKALGGEADMGAIKILTSMVGDNLWQLDSELQKLITYKKEGKITVADIRNLVNAKIDNDIWAFTDALARNNKFLSLKILNEKLQSGSSSLELLNKMIWQFKILLLVKEIIAEELLTSAEIASRLKIHPFVAQKSLPLVKNFSLDKLYLIFNRLLDLDIGIKTGLTNEQVNFDLFIIDI